VKVQRAENKGEGGRGGNSIQSGGVAHGVKGGGGEVSGCLLITNGLGGGGSASWDGYGGHYSKKIEVLTSYGK